jgi:selenophosphate synthetase-related protein
MHRQIHAVIAEGFKPVIYIDDFFDSLEDCKQEFREIRQEAKRLNVPVLKTDEAGRLHSFNKVHVFRYGQLPLTTEATVVRRRGRVVSGNLQVSN